jgi:hypothetical protein
MHFTKLSKYNYLEKIDSLLKTSISDDKVRGAVVKFGYSQQRIEEGRALFGVLNQLEDEHAAASKAKADINHQKQQLQLYINKQYMKYLKIARIAFDGHIEATESLMLEGQREKVFNKWLVQITIFCNNLLANPTYWPYLDAYGVKMDLIQDLKKQLTQLNILSDKALQVTGQVRMLTSQKRQQTVLVQQWVSDYVKIARIALEDAPQTLRKLGIGITKQSKRETINKDSETK